MTNEVAKNIERKAKELYNKGVTVTNIPHDIPFFKDEIIIAFYNIVSEWYQGSLRITNNSYGQTVIRWLDYTKYHNSIATFIEQLKTTGVGLVANYHGTGQQNYFLRNVYSVVKNEGFFDGLVTHRKKVGSSIQITIPAIVERIAKEEKARIQENFNFWYKTGNFVIKMEAERKAKDAQDKKNFLYNNAMQLWNKKHLVVKGVHNGAEFTHYDNIALAKEIAEEFKNMFDDYRIEIIHEEARILIMITPQFSIDRLTKSFISHVIQKQKEQPIEKIEVTFKGSLHYIWKSDHDALIKHRAKLEYKFMPKYIAGCDPFDKGAASSKASIEHFMFPPQVEHSDWYNQMLQRSWDMKVRAWSKKKKVEKELAWLESKIFPTTRKEAF